MAAFRSRLHPTDDRGVALVIVMAMVAIISGLGVTVFVVSANNLNNARHDRQATSSLSNAEAGIAQAIQYLKESGPQAFQNCAPNCGAAVPWGDQATGVTVTVGGQDVYRVWFDQVIQKLDVSAHQAGIYSVKSVGSTAEGGRTVVVQVQVAPFKFPLGVFATTTQAGGTGSINTESLFSNGCIFKRSHINFAGTDPAYNIPAAAHSSSTITDSNGSGTTCPVSSGIHPNSATPCATSEPYDQDNQSTLPYSDTTFRSKSCYNAAGASAGYPSGGGYPLTSNIPSTAAMEQMYNYSTGGLSPSQLNLLRTAAQAQGLYATTTTQAAAVVSTVSAATYSAAHPNPVLFFDFPASAGAPTVDLSGLDGYGRTYGLSPGDPGCTSRAVTVVIMNGDMQLNSNQRITGSIFLQGTVGGTVDKMNGSAQLIGTLFSKTLDLTGTGDLDLDKCYLSNLPGALMDVQQTDFREVEPGR
jgi:Tfp pilus assembly protein PilX